jgi:uncharacterized protein YndB with AHSA1/START domain
MPKSTFKYVTYIRTTPEKLWSALTETEFISQYWFGCRAESWWQEGSPWRLIAPDGELLDDGEIIEADPPRRLVMRWQHRARQQLRGEPPSRVEIDIEPSSTAVKLTITHSIEKDHSKVIEAVSGGWPKVLSNLKSLLETGEIAMTEPYPTAA